MNRTQPSLILFFVVIALYPPPVSLADSSKDFDENGTKKTYYWEGSKINNLSGRLGGSPDFEDEQRRTREGKNTDQYLASIREKMARQSQADAKEKTLLTFQGQLPGNAIELTYLSPGVRVTLHMESLFDENTAMMKHGATETLQRLQTILETQEQKPLQLVIADTMDDLPHAASLNAERSIIVLSWLQGLTAL